MDRIGRILDEARQCAEGGNEEGALRRLEPILEPVLGRPWTLELWARLLRDSRPEQWERLGEQVRLWSEVVAEVRTQWESWKQERDSEEEILSPTLARLYWKQGHRRRALNLFRELVRRRPEDRALAEELRSLERILSSEGPPQLVDPLLEKLEEWMRNLHKRRQGVLVSRPEAVCSSPGENDT